MLVLDNSIYLIKQISQMSQHQAVYDYAYWHALHKIARDLSWGDDDHKGLSRNQ